MTAKWAELCWLPGWAFFLTLLRGRPAGKLQPALALPGDDHWKALQSPHQVEANTQHSRQESLASDVCTYTKQLPCQGTGTYSWGLPAVSAPSPTPQARPPW